MTVVRGIRILFGLILAWGSGILTLVVLALFTPEVWNTGLEFLATAAYSSLLANDPVRVVTVDAERAQRLIFAVSIMPVALSAATAELFRIGNFLWHAVAPGAVAALIPWLFMQSGAYPIDTVLPDNSTVTTALLVSGIVGGTVYWLIARPLQTPVVRRS